MPIGTVKFVNADAGYGFISRDDKEPKVFVHVSEVRRAGLEGLAKGQRFRFRIELDSSGRTAATDLEPVGD
ncbi:MAG: cold-shock protein [Phenylobacterium sp.]|uniref:cold-shock protein n=1 Tax=Phenylobacterium sp. TaxID=1871053 RepID=UPI0039188627